jgi:phosphoglycerate dehydrogenase-like enzyme
MRETDTLDVLILPGLTLPSVSEADRGRIREAAGPGAAVHVVPEGDAAAAEAIVGDVDVVLGFVSRRLFARAARLRWVHAIASGVDAFLYPEFVASGVVLTSEKGLVGEHLADHGFGLLLALTRQLAAARDLGPQAWQQRAALRRQEIELSGLTLGIIGLGGTGRAMARRARAFGMTCLAVDRDAVPACADVAETWRSDRLGELLARADVVAVCCPLTPETRGLLDAARLAAMKPGAFLVNVTRGEVMVEDALVAALESGHLRGAALDVVPREPLPADSRLWSLANVVMTPHTAGASQYRAARNIDRFVANLRRLRAGQPLEGVIDRQLGY